MKKYFSKKIFEKIFILLFCILFFSTFEINNNYVESKHINFNQLSVIEMLSLKGRACGTGDGGTCGIQQATGCGSCTPLSIGVCSGGAGGCTASAWQIKCYCGPGHYELYKGCN